MKKRIIFATGNENKMKEIRMILADLGLEILSMKEAGVFEEIEEDGMSFEENAEIKARAISRVMTNDIVLADDSGLEIDYLDKAPGIYSARFAGEDTSYDIKNRILLDRLEGVPDEERRARFVCAVAAVFPDGTVKVVRETIEGQRRRFQTEVRKLYEERWKVVLVMKLQGKMDSDMILFFTCRNMDVRRLK